jgi:hypothetical protein
MSRLSLNDVRCEALFASVLQCSDDPCAREVTDAIARSVRAYGSRGCAALMAQEFGEHPKVALARMRWARGMVVRFFAADPTCPPRSHANRLGVVPQSPGGVRQAA